MRRILLALSLGAACAGMTACADDYYGGGRHMYAYEHNPIGYEGYYDDFYGPVYDGYWGDGGFWYSTGPNVGYRLDGGAHFRRDEGRGYHAFHGGMHRRH